MDKLFSTTALTPVNYPDTVTVPGILNTHGHPRDTDAEKDGRAEMGIPLAAQVYEDEIGMGNTKPPLTTPDLAAHKKVQWNGLVPEGRPLKIHIAGLINESTTPEIVLAGYDKPDGEEDFFSMKMYLRAASNAHGADVDDVSRVIPVFKAMARGPFKHKKRPMMLSIHAERKFNVLGRRLNFLDRERVAIERDIPFIFKEVPDAHVTICHVSDASTVEAINYYRSKSFNIFGEACPQYTIWTCDDLFEAMDGGTQLNCNIFCLPIFKTEADRQAVLAAMLSGLQWWFFGTDGACWLNNPLQPGGVKISSLGYVIGGQTQIPSATVSYVIEKFVEAGKVDLLAGYLSHHGRDAFGLPRSSQHITFKRHDWTVPETISRESPMLGHIEARVAMAGQKCKYLPEHLIAV